MSTLSLATPYQEGRRGLAVRWEGWPALPLHVHDGPEVDLIIEGSGSYRLGDRVVEVGADTTILIPAGVPHGWEHHSDDLRLGVLHASVDEVERLFEGNVPEGLGGTAAAIHPLGMREARDLGLLFRDLLAQRSAGTFNAGLGYVRRRVVDVCERSEGSPEPSVDAVHPAVSRALARLRGEGTDLEPRELARECGISRSQLDRLFRRQVGTTVVAYRNRQRVRRYLALFGDGSRLSMTEAAFTAGFGSYPQFYRVFREVMGCGPDAYHRRRQGRRRRGAGGRR